MGDIFLPQFISYVFILIQINKINIYFKIVIHYVIGNGIDALRAMFGPLPLGLCQFGTFVKGYVAVNLSMLTLSVTIIKFLLAYVYKSMPTMEDNFLSLVIVVTINIISFLATFGRMYANRKLHIHDVSSIKCIM